MVNLQSSGFSENFQTFILTVTDYVVPVLVLVDYVFQNSKWPPFCRLYYPEDFLYLSALFGRKERRNGESWWEPIPPDPTFDVSHFADFRSAFLSFAGMSKCLSRRLTFCVLLPSIHHHWEGILCIYRWHRLNIITILNVLCATGVC